MYNLKMFKKLSKYSFLGAFLFAGIFSLIFLTASAQPASGATTEDFTLVWNPVKSNGVDKPIGEPLVPCGQSGQPDCNFRQLIHLGGHILSALIYFAIPLAALSFVYAGFLYMTAGGNSGQISKAHDIFKDVGLGLIIVLSAWLIVNTVVDALLSEKANKPIDSRGEGVNLLK